MRTKVKLYNYGSCKYLENFVIKDEYEKDKEKLKNKFDSKFIIYNPEKKKYLRHFIHLSGTPIFTEKLENAKVFEDLVEAYKARKAMIEFIEKYSERKTISNIIYNKDKQIAIDVNQIIFC
jgi:hypothetical protein